MPSSTTSVKPPWRTISAPIVEETAKATALYLNSGLAKVEALKAGYEEAILLNGQGFVAEGSAENIFAVMDGVLITPPSSAGALEGITRNSIITIARDLGYEVETRALELRDLEAADEAFFTGTAVEVTPISEVDGAAVGGGQRGPITERIQRAFFDATAGRDPRYRHWLSLVAPQPVASGV